MSTREDLEDSSADEGTEEEANFYLMADTTSEESKSESDVEVNLNDLKTLQSTYHKLLSNSPMLSKAYQSLRKYFKSLSKDHKQLWRKFEGKVDSSLEFSTQECDVFEYLKLKATKFHLENMKIRKEKSDLLEDL